VARRPVGGVSGARLRGQAPTSILLAGLNKVAPQVWNQARPADGLVLILNATTLFFTVVVAHIYTVEEKFDPRRRSGALIGFVGVASTIGPAPLGGFADHLVAKPARSGGTPLR
jgi:hypothetical protein